LKMALAYYKSSLSDHPDSEQKNMKASQHPY